MHFCVQKFSLRHVESKTNNSCSIQPPWQVKTANISGSHGSSFKKLVFQLSPVNAFTLIGLDADMHNYKHNVKAEMSAAGLCA